VVQRKDFLQETKLLLW